MDKGYVPCIDEWEEIFHFTTCKEANSSFDAINNVSSGGRKYLILYS